MKKTFLFAITALFALTSCNGDKLKQADAENSELRSDLQETLATQDSLFALLNDITDGMNQIKELEKIVTAPADLNAESQDHKDRIRQDMTAIQQALLERQKRLAALEEKLKNTSGENKNLQKTIQTLKAQIAEQQTQIETLTNQLAQANIQIDQLSGEVTNLNASVDTLSRNLSHEKSGREAAEKQVVETTNALNECFYAIGSKDELKKNKIIETGFLRKTKVLKSDFNSSFFTSADKRSLRTIPLHSKKAKLMTEQPSNSYTITDDENGQKVLTITNPEAFWKLSNYLVIQID
ncbi:MAG: lipoprotein [Muribaculaceae bacterium]|mgnify:CR=1 FL=1|nr:lipoprotein [Muribaculaceae bacterium]